MTTLTATTQHKRELIARVQAVFFVMVLASTITGFAIGLEPHRAVPSLAVMAIAVLIVGRARRRLGHVPASVMFAMLATVIFATTITCGGLHAPWLAGLTTVTAASAGALGARHARIILAAALVTLAVNVAIDVLPIAALAAPPPAYDREVEGAGRILGALLLLAVVVNGSLRGGAIVRLTLIETERAVAIEALARAETVKSLEARSRLLSDMTRALGHELAGPLAQARARIERLRARSTGVDAERLAVLARETERFAQLLPHAGPTAASGNVELARVAHEVVQLHAALASERGVALRVEARPLDARADDALVRQVVVNLVQNAIEASAPGSQVTLGTTELPEGRVAVVVDDEGPGLSPEVARRLFTSGFTTKVDGSGIGLVVARSLAERMGGALTLDNRAPAGCRATLSLPRATEVAP